MSELRWHPLLGEWVGTATHRQNRTFHPPDNYCPLCPTKPGEFPTEIPKPSYDIAVLQNRFPSMKPIADVPAVEGSELYPVRPNQGECEVILFSQNHTSTLAQEPVTQIHKLIQVWTDRTAVLGAKEFVDYVFIFENKGVEVGVTLTHPHGQIYAYPFVPPYIAREVEQSKKHKHKTGNCLICDIIIEEKKGGRIVAENKNFVAYIPFFARWPYEMHITPKRHLNLFTHFTLDEQKDLAAIMKSTLTAYDGLFNKSFPYLMGVHQAPVNTEDNSHFHFHIEFYPPLRTAEKLKFRSGSETGAGFFISDVLAEEKAAQMRSLMQSPEWEFWQKRG
ncbi:MAG: galactose-1-phosphate uridylyltransferase [Bdellovibrionota bacterium]